MTELELLAHRDFVHAIAVALIRDASTADDVVQETMLAAWRHRDSPPSSLRAWLSTCARNFARQLTRGDRRRDEREQAASVSERVPSVHDVVAREERRRAVVAAVLALDEPYRAVVLLRFYEGLPPRELARRLDLPIETARTRLKRGVEQIRSRLAREPAARSEGLRAWLAPIAGPLSSGSSTAKAMWLVAAGLLLAIGTWKLVAAGPRNGPEPSLDPGAAGLTARTAIAAANDPIPLTATRLESTPPPANEPAAPATWTLRGRVVDPFGAPIDGAEVFAWRVELHEPIRIQDVGAGAKHPSARTDADGRFEIAVPIEHSRCTLLATAEGRSPGTKLSVELGDEPTIVLDEKDFLVGVVQDEGGAPVPGARLRSWGMHGGALLEHTAESSADGRYRLEAPITDRAAWEGDSESWAWWVEVRATGFAPQIVQQHRSLDPDVEPGERTLDLTLKRGATVNGTLLDGDTREPIADATVLLVAFEGWSGMSRQVGGFLRNPYGIRVIERFVTDQSGRFAMRHVPGLAPDDGWERKGDGGPVPTGPRMLHVYALARGYATALASVPALASNDTAELTLEAWRAATVTGRVVDVEGNPVSGVQIGASVRDPTAAHGGRRRDRVRTRAADVAPSLEGPRSGDDGRFVVEGIPVGSTGARRVHLGIERNDRWQAREEAIVEATAGETVVAADLVAVPEASIVLEVVDESGQPVADARVFSTDPGRARRTDEHGRVRWFQPHYYEVQAGGRAVFRGNVRLHVDKPGYVRLLTESLLTVEGPEPPCVRVVLERAHSIRGRVVEPTGRAVARAGVTVLRAAASREVLDRRRRGEPFDDGDVVGSTATDADGSFTLEQLPAGRFCVVATLPIAWRDDRALDLVVVEDVAVDGPPLHLELRRR